MKERGAEHVSVLTHKREEASDSRRDRDVEEEEDSVRPLPRSPRIGAGPPRRR